MPIEMITEEAEQLARAGFHWRERDGVRALSCMPLESEGFTNAFSTRLGGCSPMPENALNLAGFKEDDAANIYENRRRLLRLFDGVWSLAVCWQLHSADVSVVRAAPETRAGVGDEERCDALTTNLPSILLGVKTADCVPILLSDARRGVCAAVHAGWRGTLASIVTRTLARMRDEYDTRAADVRAAIGPAAGVCCYEVGGDVIESFRARFPAAGDLFIPTRPNHARIDLHKANRQQLLDAGLSAARIHTAPLCTMCRTDLFFSYRREKNLSGRTGRLLAVIGKRDVRG